MNIELTMSETIKIKMLLQRKNEEVKMMMVNMQNKKINLDVIDIYERDIKENNELLQKIKDAEEVEINAIQEYCRKRKLYHCDHCDKDFTADEIIKSKDKINKEKELLEEINVQKEFDRRLDEQYDYLMDQGADAHQIAQCECGWYDWTDNIKDGLCDTCYGKNINN